MHILNNDMIKACLGNGRAQPCFQPAYRALKDCTASQEFCRWYQILTNTIINNHDISVYIVNLHSVSVDNPVIMYIHSPALSWGFSTVM